jgi:hypothetical protein
VRTINELKQARQWATQKFGNPCAAIFHLFFRWHDGNGMEYEGADLIASMWGGRFTLWPAKRWPLSMPVVVGPAKIADPESMAMEAWGTERLGPGVWAITPSLNQPGALHAYIVLLDVPEPPPWA